MVCNRTADIRGLKPKLCSSAHRDGSALVSFSQLWAMHVVPPLPPPPPTDSQTNTHDRILHYSRVDYPTHGESVCVGISAHRYRRRRNPFFFFFPLSRTRFQQGPFFFLSTQFKMFNQTGVYLQDISWCFLCLRQDLTWFQWPCTLSATSTQKLLQKKKKDEWANVYPHSHIVQEVSNISIHIESCHSSLKECKVMYSLQVLVSSDCLISACLTFKGCHTGNLSLRMLSAFLKVWTTASLHWWASHHWVELGAISGRVCADRF